MFFMPYPVIEHLRYRNHTLLSRRNALLQEQLVPILSISSVPHTGLTSGQLCNTMSSQGQKASAFPN